jgi:hypothetical protein
MKQQILEAKLKLIRYHLRRINKIIYDKDFKEGFKLDTIKKYK